MSLAMLFTSLLVDTTEEFAYAQNITSDSQTTPVPTTNATSTVGAQDFKTTQAEYLAGWQQLPFQSTFDTFVEPGSVRDYGVYDERPSNIFNPDTRSITLYVEPVGYGFKEGVDEEGNVLYSYNITSTVTIADKQGNTLAGPILFNFDEPLNSHNKETEIFVPITLDLEQALPLGEYTLTYTITDGTNGKSFDIVKDIRIAETVT